MPATSVDDLAALARAVQRSGLPVLVVGRGSNLLVADTGFAGLAVTLAGDPFTAIEIGAAPAVGELSGPGDPVVVRAGAAVDMPVLARQTAAAGLTGMEWAVGIPGSVGGAVRMNAGGHGADIAAALRSCLSMDLDTGRVVEHQAGELAFGYRRSAVRAHQVVFRAEFLLARGNRERSEETIRDIVRWRREHQPGGQNAGSVFTNPVGEPPRDSAGWLLEAAGLKGHRHGTAVVSEKHANFIQADPGGSADDVVALMIEMQRRVVQRFGVRLHAEVRLVGFGQEVTGRLAAGGPTPDTSRVRPCRQ
jgi:UDP-N-acetylmuramate dehydrogenase